MSARAVRAGQGGPEGGIGGRQPKAVASALVVLEEVARAGPGVTGQQVARALDLPPATAYRLLNLLVGEEYLVRLPDLSGFALGRRAVEFAGVARGPAVPRAARAVLADLRASTRFGVHLVTYSAGRMLLVDLDPENPPPDPTLLARHLHASALGRLLLAARPDLAATTALVPLTPATTADPPALAAVLDEARRTGWSAQSDELVLGRGCVATGVFAEDGGLVAGVAAAGPSARVEAARDELVARLASAADRLGQLLA